MLGEVIGCVGYDSVCECRLSVNGHPPVVEGSVNGYVQIIYLFFYLRFLCLVSFRV